MFFKRKKVFVWLLAISFLFTQILVSPILAQATGTGAGSSTDRIAGVDRYKTAVAVSQKGWKTAEYAVLARGDNFADALCAGPLAHKYGGPILLTQPNQLNSDTLVELKRLGVKHLFIAGGTGAVSQSVENALKSAGIQTVERIYGAERYETSVKIAEKVGLATSGTGSSKAVLATGSDFPDALSISGIAAKLGMPILLTAKDSLPASVGSYFQANTVTETYVVGGTGVISDATAAGVPNATRLADNDRYGTNVAVMQYFAGELNFENIYLAVGTNFADALTGAVLAAKSSGPLVLTGQTLPVGTASYLQNQLKLSTKVLGLGGRAVVPSAVLSGLVTAKEQIPVEEKYSTAGTYGPETGTKTIQGNVIISAADVTLKNTIIEGDLLLGRSIGDGDVELRDVTVKGKTIVNGGGPNSVIMFNFNGNTVSVDIPDGATVRLVAQGNSTILNVSMAAGGTLQESGLTGTGFINVTIPAGVEVILSGTFEQVSMEAQGASITVASGSVNTVSIADNAAGAEVNVGSGTRIGTLNANAQSNVTGEGQISTANVNADGVSIAQTPTTTNVGAGLSAIVGGQVTSGTTAPPPATGGGGGGGGAPPPVIVVTGIIVSGEGDATTITTSGGTLQMSAAIAPATASNSEVTWSVTAGTGGATINATGLLTAAENGTVTVVATAQDGSGVTGQIEITISNQPEFAVGDGTVGSPYQISTIRHLNNVRNYLNDSNVYFILMEDLNLGPATSQAGGTYWNEGKGWQPIGDSMGNGFRGYFDGNSKTISNLTIDRPNQDNIGLFGYLGGGEIKDVTLTSVSVEGRDKAGAVVGDYYYGEFKNNHVTGAVQGHTDVGGLVGLMSYLWITIEDCSADVTVTGTENVGGLVGRTSMQANHTAVKRSLATGNVTGVTAVGGLSGYTRTAKIEESAAAGNVTGTGNDTGGLIGYADGTAIEKSYASGNVTGVNNVGGLVGQYRHQDSHTESISNCYSRSSITGDNRVGGLIGFYSGSTTTDKLYVTSSYAATPITGTNNLAGLVGQAEISGTIRHSIWDQDINGLLEAVNGAAVLNHTQGKNTADMKMEVSYYPEYSMYWDFPGVWTINDTDNNGYPALAWQGFVHTATDIYTINPSTAGGHSDITFNRVKALQGMQIEVTISNIEAGKVFKEIRVTGDSTGDPIGFTEITAGQTYRFIMPDESVVVTVEVEAEP